MLYKLNKLKKLKKWYIPNEWKIRWHFFWSEWNEVKFFYYGTTRHLIRHDKHCQKLKELGVSDEIINQYCEPETEDNTSKTMKEKGQSLPESSTLA